MRRGKRVRGLASASLAVALLAAGCTQGVTGTPGAAGLRDPYFPRLGNGGYDVRHYALTLAYDPGTGRLDGTAEITARATQDLSAFNLDLAGLTVHGATVDGEPASVRRAGQELTLRPRSDLARGATFRTAVRYSGTPRTVTDADGSREGWLPTDDGALALGQPAGSTAWFPGNHHPSDKATYDVTVTVPEGYRAIGNGLPGRARTADGRTTVTWRTTEPMAGYLATLAVGRFDVTTSRTPAGLPVVTATDRTVTREAAPVLARLPELLGWLTENLGPYPFTSAGVIVEREGDAGYALETQTRPVIPADQFTVEILVHELAHQWYGNSVSPRSWRDMWLNESFATYAEWLYAEDFEDRPAQENHEEAFADPANWAFPPAEPPTAADISQPPVYGRGAMVLHKVRQAVGDDAFFGLLRGWAAEHRHGNASTDEFTAYVEEETGEDLTEVWDTWLYGTEKPDAP
ncbi:MULTISPECIES: M1 family metallopeptidase [Streptomyces]|uniref:Aminopeptidase N n=2 Tax=Streptomyces TaxID=1883 RepID=A0A100Y2N1_9ACTN|nr:MULTISPECIES: M1 family metallopeptidase [Streptomyces]KUH36553.1 metallopeptidase [Streptomyces kanasensis]UUS31749.1 M1 family metallopeptidase [Streptomyces changanensis]